MDFLLFCKGLKEMDAKKNWNEFERLFTKYNEFQTISEITLPELCEGKFQLTIEHANVKWPDAPWRIIKPILPNEFETQRLEQLTSLKYEKTQLLRVFDDLRKQVSNKLYEQKQNF